jgi:hypothetical protein
MGIEHDRKRMDEAGSAVSAKPKKANLAIHVSQ